MNSAVKTACTPPIPPRHCFACFSIRGTAVTAKEHGVWTVVAQQSDPDAFIGEVDPDPGNDWTLTVEVIVMRPSLTEVALGSASE